MQVSALERVLNTSAIQGSWTSAHDGRSASTPGLRREAIRRRKQRGDSQVRNRVLILGRIRELALYRAEVLHDRGFEVLTPETKQEALALIERGDVDAAVLSYTLPSTTVDEFAEQLRDHCPDCRLVAIANTKYEDRRVGPDEVVLADEGPAALVAALRKVLRHN